jgi:malonate-semialdehyde dehydrogenase (acetylating)/methylmalonate-semialdehyde dehydrogenase
VSKIQTGNGLDKETSMGPVITSESKSRILGLVEKGESHGAKVILDGRGYAGAGNFLSPTVITGVDFANPLTGTEIFGPVLTVNESDTLDDAIETLSKSAFGNSSAIFTTSGAAARKFRYEAPTGNVGVNIGVAAPMAYFPFSGWRDSFMGVMHGQGKDAIEFYTDKKVVIERWPKEWTRKF